MKMKSTLELVGWDEVKCRPIYRHVAAATAKSAGGTAGNDATKKTKVKMTAPAASRDGGHPANIVTAPRTRASTADLLADELPSLRGNKSMARRTGRRARTISLSPVEKEVADVKKVRWSGVIADEKILSPASVDMEDDALADAVHFSTATKSSIANSSRKRKKGYGTKLSSAGIDISATRIAFGDCGIKDFISPSHGFGKEEAGEESIIYDNSPMLQEGTGDELEQDESSEGSCHTPVEEVENGERTGNGVSIQPCRSPHSSKLDMCYGQDDSNNDDIGLPNKNEGNCESCVSSFSPNDSASLLFSPNSNVSLNNNDQNEESMHQGNQSPIQDAPNLSDDDRSIDSTQKQQNGECTQQQKEKQYSIVQGVGPDDEGENSVGSGGNDELPNTNKSISTPSKLCDQHSINGNANQSRTINTEQDSMEFGSIAAVDTPTTKGEESTISLNEYGKQSHDDNSHGFDDFDFTFDEPGDPKSPAPPKRGKRRSYGDSIKPVWMSKKEQASAAPADDPAVKKEAIGWDETKCRPIYHAPPTYQKTQTLNSPCYSSGAIANGDVAASSSKPNNGNDYNKRTKKRVYSSLFKRSGLSRSVREKMDIDSPFSVTFTKGFSATRGQTPQVTMGQMEDPRFSEEGGIGKEDGDNPNDMAGLDDSQNGTLLDIELEMEAITNDSNAPRAQPTSKSSLESARAFFRYLDSNHNVTMLGESKYETSPKAKANVIRTKRKIEHCEELRAKYSEYCKMAEDTCIEPISLSEFAKNWNLYFTERGVVRDGLLDED